jgi:hypothetical protein
MEFIEGQEIGIRVGGAVGLSSVVVEMVHGIIVEVAEKTFKMECSDNKLKTTCWFPKKALEPIGSHGDCFKLRKWFKPNVNQAWFLDRYSNVSGQSAQ